jgi:serine/threonine protein kinase
MAPEQWVNKVSPRSDIYALGIIYYELVTGTRPYAADTPAGVAIKQATEPVPDPRRFILELPDQVVHVILKALARRPEDRYENMGLFAIALEKLAMDDVYPPLPVGAEIASNPSQPQSFAPAYPDSMDPAKTVSSSRIMRKNKRGLLIWQGLHVFLSLLLGGLIVAAALMRIQGVVTGPISFTIGVPTWPASNNQAPAQSGTSVPPGLNPVYQVFYPLATAFNSMMANPTLVLSTLSPQPQGTSINSTPVPTSPFGALTSIPTASK